MQKNDLTELEGEDSYAEVASAMETAFVAARDRRPGLTRDELFVALLLLKDRILEQHVLPDELAPELAPIARRLYSI
jgi:hypothetical protein